MSNLTALILEDAFLIAYEAEQALLELGATSVIILQDLVEALESLNRADPFDFAVLDLSLGDGNSIEFAKQIKERGIPFVFTSGYAKPDEVAREFPDVPYLEKPYHFDRLKQVVSEMLQKRS
ncbi:response regulator [Pararhizobium haloflavum]|uniref:response regulator n=1 Tax=Pararhizobium haloflavum TaxID=2037914 RepID=UPI001300008B|nr:response regulator [Pararhizobium haloflavum]